MIIANSPAIGTTTPKAIAPSPEAAPLRPGKSASAVGQMAKQAVAAAREAGLDVPKNAQGLAASQIAQGASPESIFSAQVGDGSDVDVMPPVADGALPADTTAPDQSPPESAEIAPQAAPDVETDRAMMAAAQYDLASALLTASGDSSAQIALDLLS